MMNFRVEEPHKAVLELTWEEVQICMDTFNAYIANYGYKDTPIDKKALLTKLILFDDKYLESLEEEE